jgi:hypothetical protein
MSTENDDARSLRSWLKENRHEDADRLLDVVFDQVPATPQRRAGWLARRFPDMNRFLVLGAAAAVVVLAAFIGLQVFGGPNIGGPESTPTAIPSPPGSPTVLPLSEQQLGAGTYSLDPAFPVGITFDVPEGWYSCSESGMEQGVCSNPRELGGGGVGFWIIGNVVADPCDPLAPLLDPPVGPSVDDLVAAISNLPGFEATPETEVSVDGFQGKQFTLTAPASPDVLCDMKTWIMGTRKNGVGPGEVKELQVLDVDGVRVVISPTLVPPQTQDPVLLAVRDILASIQIEP